MILIHRGFLSSKLGQAGVQMQLIVLCIYIPTVALKIDGWGQDIPLFFKASLSYTAEQLSFDCSLDVTQQLANGIALSCVVTAEQM